MKTSFDVFASAARSYPEHDFVNVPRQACRGYSTAAITRRYGEALEEIRSLAADYRGAGYACGDRIVLVLENRLDFFLHFFALNSLGISAVPVHPQFPADEAAYLIELSESAAVVALPEHHVAVEDALARLQRPVPLTTPDAVSALAADRGTCVTEPDLDTEAAILFTSGTTGKPKACVLTNRYFHSWGRWYSELGGLISLRPGRERLLTPLPLNHQNALACSLMGMVFTGGCVIQLDRFHSSTWWETVRESGATALHYLGVLPAILLNMPATAGDSVGEQVRFGFGAGVDPKHHAAFEERFGFPLVEGWAMTETGATVCVMANTEPRHVGTRCIGRAPDTLDYRLIDEHGEDVAPGAPGEFLVRTAGADPRLNFFREYYKDEAATIEAWEGGYFHTGDVVRQGDDGSLYFVDRRKNVIRRSGENIAAMEVEAALIEQPEVDACAVTAVQDEFRGEEVMALIVVADAYDRNLELAERVVSRCLDSLAYFKVPGHVGFVDELPVGATQKVKRGDIKALSDQILGGDTHFDLRNMKASLRKARS